MLPARGGVGPGRQAHAGNLPLTKISQPERRSGGGRLETRGGLVMAAQLMCYDELATAWTVSREAARTRVEGLRLQRTLGNDGRARVMIDLTEYPVKPLRPGRPLGLRAKEAAALRVKCEQLRAQCEQLSAELAKVEAVAATNRADFERERQRAEMLSAELLRQTNELMVTSERAARVEGELTALRELAAALGRPWWKRALGG